MWLSISVRILFLSVFVKKIVIDTISNLGVDLLQLLNDDFSCPDFRVVHDLLYYPLGVRINRSKTSYTLWGYRSMISYSTPPLWRDLVKKFNLKGGTYLNFFARMHCFKKCIFWKISLTPFRGHWSRQGAPRSPRWNHHETKNHQKSPKI